MTAALEQLEDRSSFWKERFSRHPINWPELRGQMELGLSKLMAFELERDAAGGPYIVLGNETQIQFYGDTYGVTCPLMTHWFRRSITRRGAWCGHGPAMLLDTGTMERSRVGSHDAIVLAGATAIHELAHFVVWRFRWGKFKPKSSGKQMATYLESPVADAEIQPISLRTEHDIHFLRIALHASYRADLMVYDCLKHGARDLIDWDSIAPSGALAYGRALSTEFDELIGVPLSQIKLHPISERFSELWNHDGVMLNAV